MPGIYVFNGTANAIVRLFGVPPASGAEEAHSEEEVRTIIDASTRQGLLEEGEEEMIEAVFELNDKAAREVMVPRSDVVSVAAKTPLGDLFSFVAAGGHTRYPVREDGSSEGIIGVVHVGDVMRATAFASGEAGDTSRAKITARDLARGVPVVPENRRINELLRDFRDEGAQLAVVIDEWGSFERIVTMEDIVEEIVGEIRNEFDPGEPVVVWREDGALSLDGRAPIADVNEALGSRFASKDFATVGGLVLGALGRAPEVGDEVDLVGHVLRVEEVDGPRVVRLLAQRSRVR